MQVKSWYVFLLAAGCCLGGCASAASTGGYGVHDLSSLAVAYEGPELQAAVGFHQAAGEIGSEWLVLMVELVGPNTRNIAEVERSAIGVMSPDGHRYPLLTNEEFRAVWGQIQNQVKRATSSSPPLGSYSHSRRPCGEWFLRRPGASIGRDVLYISRQQICSGPMVFQVPGGVQPGRWRMVIELQESTADIPFILETE